MLIVLSFFSVCSAESYKIRLGLYFDDNNLDLRLRTIYRDTENLYIVAEITVAEKRDPRDDKYRWLPNITVETISGLKEKYIIYNPGGMYKGYIPYYNHLYEIQSLEQLDKEQANILWVGQQSSQFRITDDELKEIHNLVVNKKVCFIHIPEIAQETKIKCILRENFKLKSIEYNTTIRCFIACFYDDIEISKIKNALRNVAYNCRIEAGYYKNCANVMLNGDVVIKLNSKSFMEWSDDERDSYLSKIKSEKVKSIKELDKGCELIVSPVDSITVFEVAYLASQDNTTKSVEVNTKSYMQK